MTRFKPLLLASALAAFSLSAPLAQAQTGGVVPQAAEGSKTPPPPGQQPGAVTGSAADAPAVAGQADSQPVITPSQDRQPSQAQAMRCWRRPHRPSRRPTPWRCPRARRCGRPSLRPSGRWLDEGNDAVARRLGRGRMPFRRSGRGLRSG